MIFNYLKIALRNIRRNFTYSFINIVGLAIGLASAIVIGLWVHQESSYDEQFAHADRIVRVGVSFANIGDMAPGPEQFNEVASNFAGVAKTTSLSAAGPTDITVANQTFKESHVFYADSSFFDVFSYHFMAGVPSTVPKTAVITKELAGKYFPGGNAVGQTIKVGEEQQAYTVSGIINKVGRSHIPAEVFLQFEPEDKSNWLSAHYYNYVMLKQGISLADFKNRLQQLVKNTIYPTLNINQSYEEWVKTSSAYEFLPMPITDIYLKSDMRFDLNTGGSQKNVYIFGLVAFFIVIIAGVNFVNITTARSSKRAKEVGIRKTLGGRQWALIGQFLAESVLTTLIALILALGLAELFLAAFEGYTGVELLHSLFDTPMQLLVITAVAVGIGLVAGLYPAFYLSSFRPAAVLMGKLSLSRNTLFRNGLVVVQFTIAIGLLSCTGLVYQQVMYMQNKDMGLAMKDVVVITNIDQIAGQQEVFKQQLLSQSGVVSASYNRRIPAGNSVLINTYKTPEMQDGLRMQSFEGDYDFVPTMGFQLLKGRNFSRDIAGDTSAVILNEAAVRALGLKQPLGARLNDDVKVIGVVSNFNFESLKHNIEPVAITLGESARSLAVRVNTADISELKARMQTLWQSYDPGEPMDYYFLDQNYARMIAKEKVLARAILLFSVLAIIISCLGLYGLSAYICELRTKEIGVRKVLGATVSDIVVHLTKDFTQPVMIAIVLAVPVAFLTMYSWLQNFAFRIDIDPWVFVISCLGGLGVAWLTVSWQSLKTALMNPVNSLRSE